jgi:hypothetical protein
MEDSMPLESVWLCCACCVIDRSHWRPLARRLSVGCGSGCVFPQYRARPIDLREGAARYRLDLDLFRSLG